MALGVACGVRSYIMVLGGGLSEPPHWGGLQPQGAPTLFIATLSLPLMVNWCRLSRAFS